MIATSVPASCGFFIRILKSVMAHTRQAGVDATLDDLNNYIDGATKRHIAEVAKDLMVALDDIPTLKDGKPLVEPVSRLDSTPLTVDQLSRLMSWFRKTGATAKLNNYIQEVTASALARKAPVSPEMVGKEIETPPEGDMSDNVAKQGGSVDVLQKDKGTTEYVCPRCAAKGTESILREVEREDGRWRVCGTPGCNYARPIVDEPEQPSHSQSHSQGGKGKPQPQKPQPSQQKEIEDEKKEKPEKGGGAGGKEESEEDEEGESEDGDEGEGKGKQGKEQKEKSESSGGGAGDEGEEDEDEDEEGDEGGLSKLDELAKEHPEMKDTIDALKDELKKGEDKGDGDDESLSEKLDEIAKDNPDMKDVIDELKKGGEEGEEPKSKEGGEEAKGGREKASDLPQVEKEGVKWDEDVQKELEDEGKEPSSPAGEMRCPKCGGKMHIHTEGGKRRWVCD
jgi:DNA-directed RNA polymerase subunit RPC12/RpoP